MNERGLRILATSVEQVDSLIRASQLALTEEEIRTLTDASG